MSKLRSPLVFQDKGAPARPSPVAYPGMAEYEAEMAKAAKVKAEAPVSHTSGCLAGQEPGVFEFAYSHPETGRAARVCTVCGALQFRNEVGAPFEATKDGHPPWATSDQKAAHDKSTGKNQGKPGTPGIAPVSPVGSAPAPSGG